MAEILTEFLLKNPEESFTSKSFNILAEGLCKKQKVSCGFGAIYWPRSHLSPCE